MHEYRWNVSEFAAGYDAAAEHIHPHYLELQQVILELLPFPRHEALLLVDAGGGSGRFAERFLDSFPNARAWVLDQSEPFLALAERRLDRFGSRAHCQLARLQDDWLQLLTERPGAIVSMSAIHHLDSDEKRRLYAACAAALKPGGVLINADEVRPADDADYLARCRHWAAHMHQVLRAGLVPISMHAALLKWETRNVTEFGNPRVSGDDCHETVDDQLRMFTSAGLDPVDCPWQREMWGVLRGIKPQSDR